MNRCKNSTNALTFIALCASMAAAALAGLWPLAASAQVDIPRPQTQNEAAIGGRTFPVGTLRGKFMVVDGNDIQLDGNPARLSPGARIRNQQNLVQTTGSLVGLLFLVNYTVDAAQLVKDVWILTPEEASAPREAMNAPFLNIWPFVTNNTVNTQ